MDAAARARGTEAQAPLWRPLRRRDRPNEPGFQEKALACGAFEALIGGAAGPGKTDLLLIGALRFVHRPWCKALILRQVATDLQEILDRAHQLYPSLGGKWRASQKRYVWPGGGWVKFGHCDSYRVAVKNHRGQQYTYLGWDELGEVAEERTWTFLLSRVRSTDPEAVLLARASANPGGVGHAWIKARFVTATRYGAVTYQDPTSGLERAFIPGRLEDNPLIEAEYRSKILLQSELVQRQLFGDWDAAAGLAFEELDAPVMFVRPRPPEAHWTLWAGHDWGFAHWCVTVCFAQDHHGQIWVLDTVWLRRLQAPQICEELWERLPMERIGVVYAGHDLFQERKAHGEGGVQLADRYWERGVPVAPGVVSRRDRYQYCRDALAWRARGYAGENIQPRVLFHDTPGNRRLFEQLVAMVCDPDDVETVLKVDADPADGKGGDDGWDAFSFGLTSARSVPTDPVLEEQAGAWDEATLRHEYEQGRRVKTSGQLLELPGLGAYGAGEVD